MAFRAWGSMDPSEGRGRGRRGATQGCGLRPSIDPWGQQLRDPLKVIQQMNDWNTVSHRAVWISVRSPGGYNSSTSHRVTALLVSTDLFPSPLLTDIWDFFFLVWAKPLPQGLPSRALRS